MNKSERRKASEHKQGVDFISNLPDSILLLILSRLPSIENVIRTSILSRRWKYLWTSVPSLDLKPSKKVIWTVERWIHATVMRNVKRLDLDICPEEDKDMVIPHCLATCASLEVLRLNLYRHRVIFPGFSGFPALRVLNLEAIELFNDDSVKYFLESCPMLEELKLENCVTDKLDLLCISCPKLKKLMIYDWVYLGFSVSVKLFCPELVFLDLKGQITSQFISEPMYSLKESEIYSRGERIRGLFPGISPVESLKTDIYVLDECMYDEHVMALPNLKTLDLNTPDSFCILEDLTQILKCCPELKSLSLNIENVDSWPEDPKLDEVGKITDPELKWVEFFEFNGEKPKIDIEGFGNDWRFIYATWGTKPGR